MPKRFDPSTGRRDYWRAASSGGVPGAHTHPPADVIPQGAGSLLNADLLDGYSSAHFQVSDADLAAIAVLTGNGYAKRIGADTWILDTPATGLTHSHIAHEIPTGSGSGPYTLASTPVSGSLIVSVSGVRQRQKATPGLNEYDMVAADQFTFGWDPSGLYICCDYQLAVAVVHNHVINEEITDIGTTVYLDATPLAGSEVLFFNLIRLRRLPSGSPGLNEYTISGATITLASPGRQSGDYMTAEYLT